MRYSRHGPVRFLSHLDLIRAVERALRRTTLELARTEGFHPRVRLAFASALPVGAESNAEWLDLDLVRSSMTTAQEAQSLLNATLPPGLAIEDAREIGFPCKSLGGIIRIGIWRLTLPADVTVEDVETRIKALPETGPWNIIRRSQRRDVRSLVDTMDVSPDGLEIRVRIEQNGSVKPDELLSLLGFTQAQRHAFRSCRQALLSAGSNGWVEPWGETLM